MKKLIILCCLVCTTGTFAQSVPSYIPSNGLVGWYPFTGNANDMSGAGNNGIVVGATLTTDRFGANNAAYYFNGILDHISIPTNFFNIGWSGFTISCWLNTSNLSNPNNNNTNQCIFNSRPHQGIALDFNWRQSNKYSVWAGSNPPSAGWNIFSDDLSTNSVTTNTWNNLILVKNGTTYSLYINGVLDNTYTTSTSVISNFCKMVIGQTDSTVATETFFGKLDDFGMWNRALTSTEITQVFQNSTEAIKSNTSFSNMAVYPNPAQNNFTIETNTTQKQTLQVFDVNGKLVLTQSIFGKTIIDVSNLNAGLYNLSLITNEGVVNKRLVVVH
jgi:hypothetical protein